METGETLCEEVVTEDSAVPSSEQVLAPAAQPGPVRRSERLAGEYYKPGQEGTYKQYLNQYTEVTHSLSRSQVKEETDKMTRLSHKFSLTDASSFRWVGSTEGPRSSLVATMRSTILQLEQNIPAAFMHCNWTLLRRPWMSAVQASSNPSKDFAQALTVLVCCIKPCVLLPVWTDSLGHVNIKRVQAQSKEEKKKSDKKEKKEREDEEVT